MILSVAAGALRRFLESRGDDVPDYLVALVPVSIRRPDEKGELGNRISTIMVRLPLCERDPRKRLEQLRDETERLKESDNARAASLIIEATGWTPPTINRLLSSAMARPLIFNLVVSNVPGPAAAPLPDGAPAAEIYPFVPLSPQNHALSIGMISYDGRIFFGLAGDRDVVPDLDDLATALRRGAARAAGPAPQAGEERRPPRGHPAKGSRPQRRKARARRRTATHIRRRTAAAAKSSRFGLRPALRRQRPAAAKRG